MNAAVWELAQGPERIEAQLDELARAREVKERVAAQGARRQPDRNAEDGSRERDSRRREEI